MDKPVDAESANAVDRLAGLQIALGNGDPLTDRACHGRYRRVAMNDRSADGRSDLNMRQVKWRIKDVEWAIAELVIRQLDLFQRRVLMDNDKRTSVRSGAKCIVD